jgi:RHS repeat-associated protein
MRLGRKVVALAALLVAVPAADAAAQRPDLSVSKSAVSPARVEQGARVTVSWTIRNGGRSTAGKSTTELLLSTDAKRDKRDIRLAAASQKAIKARKTARGKRTITIPASVAARRYSLLVCADARAKVKESSERNNCRARPLTVLARSTTPGPTPQPGVPGTPPGPVVTPAPQPGFPSPTASPLPTPAAFTTTITAAPPAVTPHRNARFEFTANQAATGFECSLDDAAFAPCASPYVIDDILAGEHSFEVRAVRGSVRAIPARKAWRIEFEAPAPGPEPPAAPDPATLAPVPDSGEITLLSDTTKFLYTGANPIQKDVASDAIEPLRVSVLRGKVVRRNGSPIDGVQVRVLDAPELGWTATRTDGGFDIAVNGGGVVTLVFERAGYIPVQRRLEVPTGEFEGVEEIVMVPYEDRVTGVDLSEGGIARGSVVTDGDGTRQATLVLEPGTKATAKMPDGELVELPDTINVRATEFTIGASGPAAMPGELPLASAYTYAVEYSVDEAAGASEIAFDKPVVTYVDNFLAFPAGTRVPMGYYDRERGEWVPAPDGVVIAIVGEQGGRALVDVDGDGQADSGAKLDAHGIDDAELQRLAELYDPGKSLWRSPIDHFTPWDYNWPYGLPDGATGPDQGGPDNGDPDGDDRCREGGSIIYCESQALAQASPISGTPYTLVYQSDRMPGRRSGATLNIPLTGPTPPESLARIEVTVSVAGKVTTYTHEPAPNLTQTFEFDGTDAYGRPVQGRQRATVTVAFVYPAVYRSPESFNASFAQAGGATISTTTTRQELSVSRTYSTLVGGIQAPNVSALAGWNIDVHHTYDPVGRTLYLGDGRKRSAEGANYDVIATTRAGLSAPEGMVKLPDGALLVADSSAHVIRKVVPGGAATVFAGAPNEPGDADGPADEARFEHPADVAVAPDGTVYVADQGNHRVRRIVDGRVETIAGTGDPGYAGDDGPALEAELDEPTSVAVDRFGAVLVSERANHVVRRIGTDGRITTLAGTGFPGDGEDPGRLAARTRLRSPRGVTVAPDGGVLIADVGNHRIRRVDPDGTIATIAGNGVAAFSGDGGPATAAGLDTPSAVVPLRDGGLLIADAGNARLRKVTDTGRIVTIAGNGITGATGDGGAARRARVGLPQAIAVGDDDTIYFADAHADRIRELAPQLPGVDLGELSIPSDDGRSLYIFDRTGRHLRTLDTLTGEEVLRFGYDSAGRLTSIRDGDGNETAIVRDLATGRPSTILSPAGEPTDLTVNEDGYLSSIRNPGQNRITMEYTAGGLLTELTDPRGYVHEFAYDAVGRLIRDTAPDGSFQTLSRNVSAGGVVTVTRTSNAGRVTTYRVERTEDGGLKRTVTAVGDPSTTEDDRVTTTVVDTAGVTTVTRPDGTQTSAELAPDPRFGMEAPYIARMSVITPASGRETVVTRSRVVDLESPGAPLSLRSLTERVTIDGRTQTSHYDALTRTFTDTTPEGRVTTTEVDGQARPVRIQAGSLTPVTVTYNARGQVTETAQGTRSETLTYDSTRRIKTITDPLQRTTEFTYDPASRPDVQTLPDGREIDYDYDANGNLLRLRPPGKPRHEFKFNNRNVLETYTPPLVSGASAPWTYATDADKLLTSIARPGGSTVTYSYDLGGRLTSFTQLRGTTTFEYDGAQLARATAPGGERVEYEYDGPLVTRATTSGSVASTLEATYTDDLKLESDTVSSSPTVTYAYDDDGALTRAGDVTLTRRQSDGLLSGLSAGVTETTITRSAFGEPASFESKAGGAVHYAESYTRDDAGRIVAKTETRGTESTTWEYGYDAADRLAEVKRDGELVRSYAYDDNGNRTQLTPTGGTPVTGSYDTRDRLVSYGGATYTYNTAGDLTGKVEGATATSYSYDEFGALTRVVRTGENPVEIDYLLDPAGRRIAVRRNGTITQRFVYGRPIGPLASIDGGGTVTRYVYGTRSNVPDSMIRDGVTYRIVTDQVGSPRAVVNTATGDVVQELDYDEFGRVTRDTNPGFQPFGFAGGLYDADTGLVRLGARDYDPETGRFTTPDPLRFGGGGTNLYGYALGDPVNLADPSGAILDTVLDIGFIAYDLYKIGRSLMNGCGVNPVDAAALGADIAGALIPFGTGGGAAVRAGAHAAPRVADNITEGIYVVTTKEGLPYVGQSGNIPRRLQEHVRSGKITQEAADNAIRTEVLGGKTAREIAEQRRINELTNGVGAADPGIANKVNPIGPSRQHLLD